MKIIELTKEKFDDIIRDFPNLSFYQNSGWATLKSYTEWEALYLAYLNDKNDYEAAGLFLLKKTPLINAYLAYCPRGYLINFNDLVVLDSFHQDLVKFLKERKVFELIIDPYLPLNKRDINGDIVEKSFDNRPVVDHLIKLGYQHNGYNLYYENLQPRWLFRLNLKNKDMEEIFQEFKKETRRRILKKDLYAINVREMTKEEIPQFKQLMNDTSIRRGFNDRSLGYYEQMYAALHDKGILKYMAAELDVDKCRNNIEKEIRKCEENIARFELHPQNNAGKIKEENVTLNSFNKILEQLDRCENKYGKKAILSCVCLLSCGKESIMLLAGNDEEYLQHFNTSNIIVYELIKMAKESGYDYYNFYGISGNFDPKNESYGLYAYKKQYGGEVVELIGQFSYIINEKNKKLYDKAYSLYRKIKR